ncbi:hypothetical protein SAM23877_4828 [Streptomyces ambofaciens ATCC 23877]|uniref:Uncharacterized protein n=1 Tax=Streptomyces ambofaciens (strain ATCC 23877 / 3486 / DSM 40053 / JCM 4204 / NBRC 12836 / NRRL B-2516) TaxID=278992 RepID=A0A0K2AY31_STRA7|nr:hypothetical protein SAM23877_4828 [Streptomyces ambofaciens ATCC 23877]
MVRASTCLAYALERAPPCHDTGRRTGELLMTRVPPGAGRAARGAGAREAEKNGPVRGGETDRPEGGFPP